MKEYDVIIIGGGIHGAGVLQAVVAAGHRALLIERQSLASGTSSKSSKLIHGGLRYLESAQFALVRESLRERSILLRIAPELVKLQTFYLPVYPDTRRRPWQLKIGLWMYALLGGFDSAARFGSVPRAQWSSLDGLQTNNLQAVIRYHDGQTDDAVLTRAVVQSAMELGGAEVAMPASFEKAVLKDDGVAVTYKVNGGSVECSARVLINAAGPWAPHVAAQIEPPIFVPAVDLVQGTHIVIQQAVTAGIYYVESPTDGRAVFVMPWHGATLIGTTETPYTGSPEKVHPLPEEEEYLLAVVRHYFPALATLTRADITERFAGLRVLPSASQAAFDRSRETIFTTDRDLRPRVLGIYGGKLTGWRAAAAHVMERIDSSLPQVKRRAATDQMILRRPLMTKNVTALMALAPILAMALPAASARAEDYLSPTLERVRLSIGASYQSTTTDLQLDSSTGVQGTPVNAEDTFGLDKHDIEPKFQAMVRVGERHRLRFDYFGLDRTGSTTIVDPIIFRDVTLQPGDPLTTNLSLRTLGINYEYSFLHSDRYEVAFSIGVNDTDVSARGRVATQTRHVDQTEDQAGPLPTVGLDATYVLSKRFYFDARGQYLKVHVDNLSGSLGIYELDAFYRLRPNIAFAIGYNIVKADLTSTKTTEAGFFDFSTKGPEVFVRIAF